MQHWRAQSGAVLTSAGDRDGRRSAARRAHRNAAPADARGARPTPRVAQDGAYSRAARRRGGVRCADDGNARRGPSDERLGDARVERMRVVRVPISISQRGVRASGGTRSERRAGRSRVRGSRARCLPPAWSTNGCCTSRRNCWARTRNLWPLSRDSRSSTPRLEFELLDSKRSRSRTCGCGSRAQRRQ